jgi:dTDP-4-dehydrorhamnose reductase
MKILITGSNGLLGQKLVEYLESVPEITCIATSRGKRRFQTTASNVVYESMDILQFSHVKRIIEKHQPEVLINTAAMTQADLCEKNKELCYLVNVEAVKKIVEYCGSRDIHFIQLSTDFVFDGKAGPYNENNTPNPVNFYGESKYLAEQIVMNTFCSSTVIRTILVYGITPNMNRSNIVLWVKNKLEKGEQIQVVNDQVRNPTLVEDLVSGCILISIKKKNGIYHIGGKDTLTPYQFACETADFFGLDGSLITPVDARIFTEVAKRPLITGLIIEKAEKELGYQPHSIQAGLALVGQQLKNIQLQ